MQLKSQRTVKRELADRREYEEQLDVHLNWIDCPRCVEGKYCNRKPQPPVVKKEKNQNRRKTDRTPVDA